MGALAAPVSAIAQSGFDDVPPGHTHEAGIEYLVDTGITQGCDSDSYCPEDSLTRAQMATFLYRSSGNDPATSPSVNAAQAFPEARGWLRASDSQQDQPAPITGSPEN